MLMMMPPLLRYFWFHSIYSLAASCSLQSAVCSLRSANVIHRSRTTSYFTICRPKWWGRTRLSRLGKRQNLASATGKINRCPFFDILGYLKNTHKNPKFGRVRQVPTMELCWEFPVWDLSQTSVIRCLFSDICHQTSDIIPLSSDVWHQTSVLRH